MRLGLLAIFVLMMKPLWALKEPETLFAVEIAAKDKKERSRVANIIHIDSIRADRVFSVVNGFDLSALRNEKNLEILSLEMLGEKGLDDYYKPFLADEFPKGDEAFHTFSEVKAELDALAKDHSELAQVFSIGKSVEGRDIWALRVTDGQAEGKPAIAYLGTHHAREHVSTEIPLMFAKDILLRSVTDEDIKSLLKSTELYIIPLVNPDGATFDISSRRYQYWRKNRQPGKNNSFGVDLNRNYGYGWGTGGSSSNPRSEIYMGKAPFSEPETQSVKNFFLAHKNITIALTFHSYSELILYPWGGKDEAVLGKDGAIFSTMARKMAKMNGYKAEQASDLYIASGDTCDWLYGELSVYCFTFELSPSALSSDGFYPGAAILDRVYRDNLKPMLYLASYVDNPARVLDKLTDEPIDDGQEREARH